MMASSPQAVTETNIPGLHKIATGKVRDLYEVTGNELLFVATDRISAFDIILKNGIPGKGVLLTKISKFWFDYLSQQMLDLRTHLTSTATPEKVCNAMTPEQEAEIRSRSMLVRRLNILPIESIVRGYITGSAWKEYQSSSTVHGIEVPTGLRESQALPGGPMWTPSTKAEVGGHDENIHPSRAQSILAEFGPNVAADVEKLSLDLYKKAHDYAQTRGIIIADTKFEFGIDDSGEVVLADEVLTPDSSRFWPADDYEVGRGQASFDKQPLRDWLIAEGLKGKEGVDMPPEVVEMTRRKYEMAYQALTGDS